MGKPPFILGAQYFRPPFPRETQWEDDIKAMRDAGLNCVQMWLVWGWCEPEPGKFVFDDYDRIADLAAREGLGLVLSVLPEINPFWLPRLHPDGLMVDIEGRAVLSCNRTECIAGLVPGCCSDHPAVRGRMTDFLRRCGEHFGGRDELLAWDVWNENRWRNCAPEIVCFCQHSLDSQRRFLKRRYGSLEALGAAWGRRLCSWADARVGRLLGNSYPEMRDFTHWTCRRAEDMARWRVAALRRGDPRHVVGSHTGNPSIYGGINLNENIFSRGVDWDVAAGDSYGYSSFPVTAVAEASPVDFCVRTSAVAAAGGEEKPKWMSELQGGPSAHSRLFSRPLPGPEQQAWIWTGVSRGAKAALLWCWRPEVFGNESNGFGFTGFDGHAESRRAAMQRTAAVLARHGPKVEAYRPDPPEVGVLFQRDSYIYSWLARGWFNAKHSAPNRFLAYPRALERLNVPYVIHDDRHLPEKAGALKLMVAPNPEGLDDGAAEWLARFAESGGSVFIEGGAGAFGPDTFWREPNGRPFYRRIGLAEDVHRGTTRDRRTIPAGAAGNEKPLVILPDEFEVGYAAGQPGVVALEPDGFPMLACATVGRGRVVCVGSVIGERMDREDPAGLDELLRALLRYAAVEPKVRIEGPEGGFCTCRLGTGLGKRLLLVTNFGVAGDVTMTVERGSVTPEAGVSEWFGHKLKAATTGSAVRWTLSMAEHDSAVLEW